ncbi:hypothetical protein D3C75_306750 [compost metagenome]
MTPLLHKFPLDWTGTDLRNRTRSEMHDMSALADLDYRCVVLDHGYFYTNDLYIIDEAGYELKETVDYQLVGFNTEVAGKTAKTVVSIIVITSKRVASKIYVDAQMVGGGYEKVGKAIDQMAMGLLNNTRKVHWTNIKGKPDKYPAGGHWHALWDLYGFTPSVTTLKRMSTAFGLKTQQMFDGVFKDFDTQMKVIEGELAEVEALLTTHIADTGNPHKDTAAKIGLGSVLNAPTATLAQARLTNGNLMSTYATPWSVGQALDANFFPILAEHVANRNNPHRNTLAQLNMYSVAQYNAKSILYVDGGATMDKSSLIYGMTTDTLRPLVQQNNHTNNLTIGMYPFNIWARPYIVGLSPNAQVLKPDGYWQNIADVITREVKPSTKIIVMQGEFTSYSHAITTANTWLTTYPYGTLLFCHWNRSAASFNGNGAVQYANTRFTTVLVMTANGWITTAGGA